MLVGADDAGVMRLELPLVDFFSRGGALRSSWYGDCAERDFPMLIDLYGRAGLPLDKFVTERIRINDVKLRSTR